MANEMSEDERAERQAYAERGLDYDDFYHGEEAADRFRGGMKCMLRQPLTPAEELVRQSIVESMDKGIAKSRVGGAWQGGPSKAEKEAREKAAKHARAAQTKRFKAE